MKQLTLGTLIMFYVWNSEHLFQETNGPMIRKQVLPAHQSLTVFLPNSAAIAAFHAVHHDPLFLLFWSLSIPSRGVLIGIVNKV